MEEKADADVVVRSGKVGGLKLKKLDGTRSFWATSGQACYQLEGVGRFLVSGGKDVLVDRHPNADERTLRLCLLGPVAALILHQRGYLVLHASAVAVNGSGIAFVGGQGWGKSTLAAAFNGRGHGTLADDVTAIQMQSDQPMVIPAFPHVKLWPDSLMALGELPERLPVVHPDFTKRSMRVNGASTPLPMPLKRIYVLASGPRPEIQTVSPSEALLELIGHSYSARFGGTLLESSDGGMHLRQCARIVRNTIVYRFRRPPILSMLDDHVSMLAEHFAIEAALPR